MIYLEAITKSYRLHKTLLPVLKGIDLHIKRGEIVAIMGESGSGKSTLMNILGLLDNCDTGHYYLNDREIGHYQSDELATARNELIGFVFQSFYLLPRLTALDNVALPLMYRGLGQDEKIARSQQALEKVDMLSRSHHKPNELSGGQCQRVAIARAIVGQPKLILADEPTGALDPRVGNTIMNLFLSLNEQENITLIIITHDPKVAARCHRTVLLEDGYVKTIR